MGDADPGLQCQFMATQKDRAGEGFGDAVGHVHGVAPPDVLRHACDNRHEHILPMATT